MLEERKQAYAKAGYFDADRKRPIPENPTRVAVVTSPTGAALRDILQVLGRRSVGLDVLVLPAPVQGEGAAEIIAARIDQANKFLLADVIIVGRGGGALEDLLPFSEPCVIEAIYRSEIPVVSAVGHEIDWALSDFAADLRAPTPSAAAELVCKSGEEQIVRLRSMKRALTDALIQKTAAARLAIERYAPRTLGDIQSRRIEQMRYRLDDVSREIGNSIRHQVGELRHRLSLMQNELNGLSPVAILERGYAVVTDDQGSVVSDAAVLSSGDGVSIRFAAGAVHATID
jgi:exodeoxyribonuclease VII large subunit